MAKTFAQYLIDKVLPGNMHISRQIDSSYLKEILTDVARNHNEAYADTVMRLKHLGDTFSTLEPTTMGLDEISVPNKKQRDAIISKYTKLVAKDAGTEKVIDHLENLQKDLAENDMKGTKDDASVMVRSALTSGKYQLMKLRTSPGVVADNNGKVVPEIFPKSYAEGVDPFHFWLGATESRKNVAEGQVATAKPGELNKVLSGVLATAVVSTEDCGTQQGILLSTRDDDVLDRYLARSEGKYPANTLITADVQQALLKDNVLTLLVRSPQTCQAAGGSICKRCMGLRPGTGKPYQIGDNAGMITAGTLGEPLTQMALSSKHSTSLAKAEDPSMLKGEKGFRQLIESPTHYPNRKILCEMPGVVYRIRMAPQGGRLITIHQTQMVPDRYIVNALPVPKMKRYWDYHVPPNLRLVENLKEGVEVFPGMALSTGVDNLQDVARLRNLGYTRSVAAQNMYDVYKNTGNKMDRRHFELLSRYAHPYVNVVKVPEGAAINPGETIEYSRLASLASSMPTSVSAVSTSLGKVLGKGVLDLTVGTEVDARVQEYLKNNGVKEITVIKGLEIAAASVPMTRVLNQSQDWVAAMNHRYLKTQMREAASTGKRSNIHGFNPITAYAYGVEMGSGAGGKY